LRSFLDPNLIQKVRRDVLAYASTKILDAWRQKVEVASDSPDLAQSCRTIDECQAELQRLDIAWDSLPFLQYFNTWRHVESVKSLCYSLGQAASILLDVPSVRLYQDALFSKRAVDGPTPWHTDARMAPFDTSHMITFWIPLQAIPKNGGTALDFVSKSHSDFALPFWNKFDGKEYERLDERYKGRSVHYMPMKVGDVTVHSGWTLHCADGNTDGIDRHALAISFVDAEAEVREQALDFDRSGSSGYGDNEDHWSYKEWVQQVPARKKFRHALVPVVWPSDQR
jgi:ectoine hydroxylase-related dioxygenase (phytanoyl-CoA dioxygenase family)